MSRLPRTKHDHTVYLPEDNDSDAADLDVIAGTDTGETAIHGKSTDVRCN